MWLKKAFQSSLKSQKLNYDALRNTLQKVQKNLNMYKAHLVSFLLLNNAQLKIHLLESPSIKSCQNCQFTKPERTINTLQSLLFVVAQAN